MNELLGLIASSLRLDQQVVTQELSMQHCDRWDSLSHMNLITNLEQKYNLQFSMDEIIQMTSVESIMKLMHGKGAL